MSNELARNAQRACSLAALLLLYGGACGASGSAEQSERTQGVDGPRSATGGEARRPANTLKIASWNLEWLNRKNNTGPVRRRDGDYERLQRYARRLDADVVALQEVDGPEAVARVFDPEIYEIYVAAQSDPQRTGFAYRRGLRVTIHPDYAALDVGQVRVGADMTIELGQTSLRMLSIHLKSGCFDQPLTSESKDCRKLAAQVPSLEAWVDARAADGSPALLLGDFNRRLFRRAGDELWSAIDDGEPPASDLWSPTEGRTSRCWDGKYPEFVDHIVLNAPATAWAASDGFEELVYDDADSSYKRGLSDHCPIAITLVLPTANARTASPGAALDGSVRAPHEATLVADAAVPSQLMRIKGNVGAGGRKIYHAPACPDYARTKIDEAKGERFFDSAEAAEAAGFTRSNNCPGPR